MIIDGVRLMNTRFSHPSLQHLEVNEVGGGRREQSRSGHQTGDCSDAVSRFLVGMQPGN